MAAQKRSLAALIIDIQYWIARGCSNSNGTNPVSFGASKSSFDAGNWAILCVGEAAGKILKHYPEFGNEELRKQLTAAYVTRNRLAHGYYDLNAEQIWETLEFSFPELLLALQPFVTDGENDAL